MKRDFRKPLIVMSPKSLLRHPKVISKLADFTEGAFQEVIGDEATNGKAAAAVERAVLCSGKVYYDLLAAREALEPKEQVKFALIRVEQLYPFPDHRMAPILKSYKGLKEITWCQEEPKNMGSWFLMKPKLDELLENIGLEIPVKYAGRDERASPATGSEKVHATEQKELLKVALTLSSARKGGSK